EHERIEGREYAEQAGLHKQHQGVERAGVFVLLVPEGGEQDNRHQHRSKQHQHQAEAVDAEVKIDARRRYPIDIEVETGRA
nr:hypothetical protein [Tanacetum cinerariifolium]